VKIQLSKICHQTDYNSVSNDGAISEQDLIYRLGNFYRGKYFGGKNSNLNRSCSIDEFFLKDKNQVIHPKIPEKTEFRVRATYNNYVRFLKS
jgi:hypothetical protein